MVFGHYRVVLVDPLWYCVSVGRYLLVLGDTGLVLGATGWYFVVLGQY